MADFGAIYKTYLRADHLPPGQLIQVAIEAATIETLHPRPGQELTALVLAFKGKQRRLVVNNSNASRLADIAGSTDTAALIGLVIGLKRAKYGAKETILIEAAPTKNGAK